MLIAVGEEGTEEEEAGCRRSSLVGQALVPCPTDTASELCKERSFCNPEDTEEAAAIGRQVCCAPCQSYCDTCRNMVILEEHLSLLLLSECNCLRHSQVACGSAYNSTDMLEVQKTWWDCSPELYAAIAPELLRLQKGFCCLVTMSYLLLMQ